MVKAVAYAMALALFASSLPMMPASLVLIFPFTFTWCFGLKFMYNLSVIVLSVGLKKLKHVNVWAFCFVVLWFCFGFVPSFYFGNLYFQTIDIGSHPLNLCGHDAVGDGGLYGQPDDLNCPGGKPAFVFGYHVFFPLFSRVRSPNR